MASRAYLSDAERRGSARAAGRRPALSLALADVLLLVLAGLAAVTIGHRPGGDAGLWTLEFLLATLVVLHLRRFYAFRLGGSILPDLGRIVAATALAAMALLSTRVIVGDTAGATTLATRLWLYATVFVAGGRVGIALDARRAWVDAGEGLGTLIIGAGRVGRLVGRRLRDRPELGLRPVGHIDDEPLAGAEDDLPMLGGTRDLERVVDAYDVRHVIITFARGADQELLSVMHRCKRLGVEVAIVPRLYEEMTHRLTIEHVGGLPLIRVDQPDPRGWQFALKYALDRVAAAAMLLALAPLMMAIAIAVRLSSPGPIFFRQRRVGRDGREFEMLKFRSMRGDPSTDGEADAAWAASLGGIAVGSADASAGPEDRRTPVGRLLRRTSLDELPQLINVLVGEMSLVGPRPERVGYVREFSDLIYRYSDRHRVKSGVTGWAQVQGLRGETSLSDRVEWDNYYIENWTLRLDLKILLLTIPAALRSHGCDEPQPEASAATLDEPLEALAEPLEALAEPLEALAEPLEAVVEPPAVEPPLEATA